MSETAAKPACIAVSGLSKAYGKGAKRIQALTGVSLDVDAGEILGLIGPNGAGKTTLIGCILGLLFPDEGQVRIFGQRPEMLAVRRQVGYMPERPDFEYWMDARWFLTYHYGLAGLPDNDFDRKVAVESALEQVELPRAAWGRRLKTYSRGMLQRLNLAQVLIGQPAVMLFDEPTLGLDPGGVAVVRDLVKRMRERGVTAIVNSHQLDEVERLCDRVAFIAGGRIAAVENLHAGEPCDYVVCVRWGETSMNGSLLPCLRQAAQTSGAQIKELSDQLARYVVKDKRVCSDLVKALVAAGLPVAEVIPERGRLEELFLLQNGRAEATGGSGNE